MSPQSLYLGCRAGSPASLPGQRARQWAGWGQLRGPPGSPCPNAQGPHRAEVALETAGPWVPPSGGHSPRPGSPGVHCGQVNRQTSLSSQRPLSGRGQAPWRRSPRRARHPKSLGEEHIPRPARQEPCPRPTLGAEPVVIGGCPQLPPRVGQVRVCELQASVQSLTPAREALVQGAQGTRQRPECGKEVPL